MRHTLLRSLLAAGCTVALICASPALAQISGEVGFSLPSQDLSVSLRTVSLQTGRNIVAPSELVRGRQAPAISGGFTAEEAVRLLLAGSGLQARRVGDALVIFVAGGGESPGGETNAAGAPYGENEAIVVTGTNLRGTQPTSPLITLTRRDIDRTGATSAEQLMRTVPQNTQGGVNEENSGVTLPDQDVSDHGAGLNLRGLGQRATLVLLNGRRLAPGGAGGFVDISLIPVAALERVEILTDGASAIYGSDAVGGVVNFILRDRFDGFESALQLGIATQGGGEQLLASQTAGHDWQSGRAMLTYEYRLENEIRAGERPFTVNLRPDAFLFPRERKHSVLGTIECCRRRAMAGLCASDSLECEGRVLVERLGGRWTANGGLCRCPAHDDRSPSLSVRVGRTSLLLHCFAGCSATDVLKALRTSGQPIGKAVEGRGGRNSAPGGGTRAAALRVWSEARPIARSPAQHYLVGRCLPIKSSELRYHPRTPHGPYPLTILRPALIAAVRDATGVIAVHRSFLDPRRNALAPIAEPRCGLGRFGSGAVRLGGIARRLGLAEGIETAMSASALFGLPCWATLGTERFRLVDLPSEVDELVLFLDNDAGGRRAETLARGAFAHLPIQTHYPRKRGADWNDALRARTSAGCR